MGKGNCELSEKFEYKEANEEHSYDRLRGKLVHCIYIVQYSSYFTTVLLLFQENIDTYTISNQ